MLVFCALCATVLAAPAATVTTLQVAPATTVFGEPISFDILVRNPLDDSPAQGSVGIYDGTDLVVTQTLADDGTTGIGITDLPRGDHTMTAQFVPADATAYAPSTSTAVDHDIEQAGSQVVVKLGPVDTIGRVAVLVRVLAVYPSLGTPSGTVTLYLDSLVIADGVQLVQGVISVATRKIDAGDHAIVVHYNGDSNFVDSDSVASDLVVPPEAYEVTIAPDSAKMSAGDTKAFALTITPTYERDTQVTFACRNLPAGATCSFDPKILPLAGDPQTVTVTIAIDGDLFPAAGLAVAAGLAGARRRRKLLAITGLFACLACGDARPIGHVTVQVVAASENASQAADLALQIR